MTLVKSLLVVVLFLLIATVLAPSGVRIRGEDALPPARWETPNATSPGAGGWLAGMDALATNPIPTWTCTTANDHTVYVSQGGAGSCGSWSSK